MVLLGGGAAAQRPHRTGLWGELGGGAAYSRVACSGCTEVTVSPASSGYLRIGGLLSDGVLLGVESAGFADETFGFGADSGVVAQMETLAVVVLWFPWRSGVFLKGGMGAAHGEFTIPSEATQADTSKGTGIGLTFGVGLDWPLSRKLALTANAAAFITAIGDVVLPTARVDDVIATLYHATIGFTIR